MGSDSTHAILKSTVKRDQTASVFTVDMEENSIKSSSASEQSAEF